MRLGGIVVQPFFYADHVGFAGFKQAFFQQNAADSPETAAVVVGIADTHAAAVVELGHGRSLNLHDMDVDRAVAPQQHRRGKRRLFDFFPGVVRQHLLTADPADQPHVRQIGIKVFQVKFDQVRRPAVNGINIFAVTAAGSMNFRFVIGSEFPFRVAVRLNQEGGEIFFDENLEFASLVYFPAEKFRADAPIAGAVDFDPAVVDKRRFQLFYFAAVGGKKIRHFRHFVFLPAFQFVKSGFAQFHLFVGHASR